MKYGCAFLMLILVIGSPLPAHALEPFHQWGQRFGALFNDNAFDVAIDASGNVFVTGIFQGSVDFGGGPLTSNNTDIFLAKYSAGGAHQWSRVFGGSSFDVGYSVVVDANGNPIIAGYFWNTINFGGAALTSAGGNDIFVAKFDPNGVHQWSKRFGSTNGDEGYDVSCDPQGNVVLAGFFNLSVSFGGGILTAVGGDNAFVAKFDVNGVHQWSKGFAGASPTMNGSGADAAGNVFLTGRFQGTANFGGGNLTSAGLGDAFLAKYSASGVHQWSKRLGGLGNEYSRCIAADATGNVIIAGTFEGTVDFGGGNLTGGGGFAARYDGAGVHQLSRRVGDSSPNAVSVDAAGSLTIFGFFGGTTDFGGGNLTSAGAGDVFLVQYDVNGAHQFSRRFGSTNFDTGYSVAVGANGVLVMAGYFQNTVNFGGATDLVSAGVWDAFLVKYRYGAGLPAILTSIVDVENDQGGRVKVGFSAAGFDFPDSPTPVTQYELFLRDDPLPLSAVRPADATAMARAPNATNWIYVGAVPAHLEEDYLTIAMTLADSTVTQGMHYSVYFVRAATSNPGVFFDSTPDSGYSLDNLAPGVPQGFAYNASILTWNNSPAADFDYFTVYGSATPSFGSATLIDYTVAPTLDVAADPYSYYFVTATDFSGNEGLPAMLDTSTDAVGGALPRVLSVSCYPNPFNPGTTVRFTLPLTGHTRVEVFDPRGSRVATLVDGDMPAGAHTVQWDAAGTAGEDVSSGVYFVRVGQAGRMRSYKMTLLK